MLPVSGDFCQNIAEEDSIKEHMEKYKDIFCSISEFKNLDVKSNVKDIEKVNITYLVFNQLQHSWTVRAVKFSRSLKSCQTSFLADFFCIHNIKSF